MKQFRPSVHFSLGTPIFRGFALMAALLLSGCINVPVGLFGGGRGPLRKETLIPAEGMFTTAEILVVDVAGVIDDGTASTGLFASGPSVLVNLKDRLNEAENDARIRAVIVRIDSPGGSVTASDLIHHELKQFKKRKEARDRRPVPVIAMMQDLATSGGLYAAMAADEIYAQPTTLTGSVGVIALFPGLQGLSDKIGLQMRVIKSGNNKDVGSPWRELSESDQKMLQDMVNSLQERFVGIVMEARAPKGLERARLDAVADGRVLTARDALDVGLIDNVGYVDDAIARARDLAGVSDAKVISYQYPWSYRGNVYATPSPIAPNLGLSSQVNVLSPSLNLPGLVPGGARFLYMWMP